MMGLVVEINGQINHQCDKDTVRNLQKRGLHCTIRLVSYDPLANERALFGRL